MTFHIHATLTIEQLAALLEDVREPGEYDVTVSDAGMVWRKR